MQVELKELELSHEEIVKNLQMEHDKLVTKLREDYERTAKVPPPFSKSFLFFGVIVVCFQFRLLGLQLYEP